mmetsp:Transcript_33064/g.67565  ORF Transcript_33064/g.67565 Transcript_33064/m.67565 type:complete len:87 (-) Transcript_33064:776-1036(-)
MTRGMEFIFYCQFRNLQTKYKCPLLIPEFREGDFRSALQLVMKNDHAPNPHHSRSSVVSHTVIYSIFAFSKHPSQSPCFEQTLTLG